MSETIYKKLRNNLKMSRDEVCDYILDYQRFIKIRLFVIITVLKNAKSVKTMFPK